MGNKNKRSIGLLLSYIYFIINTVISVFMSAFIIRTVGKTDYGVYQAMSAFVSYLVLLEFGTGNIMSRNVSLCKKDGTEAFDIQKNVSTIWTLTVALATIISVISFVFWNSIDIIYEKSFTPDQIILGRRLFGYAAIGLICSFFDQTLNGLLLGFEYYSFGKIVALCKLILRTVLLVFLLNSMPSVEILIIVDTLLSIVTAVFAYVFCKFKIKVKFSFKYFDVAIFKLITPIAFAMLLQAIVNSANNNVDKFLISIMMTPEDVAIYSLAMLVFGMYASIASLPGNMFMPQVAKDIRNGLEGKSLTKTLVHPCRLNVLIIGTIAFGFLSVGRPFITILYGKEYSQAWLYSIVVIFPMFMNAFNTVVINVIDVMRKRHIRSLILMITTSVNIIMTIFGIQTIGMLGAALATGISLICQTVFLNLYYQKKIGLKIGFLISETFRGILPCLLVATISSVLVQLVLSNQFFQLCVGGVVFLFVFISLYLFFGSNAEEKTKIKQMILKLKNRLVKKNIDYKLQKNNCNCGFKLSGY